MVCRFRQWLMMRGVAGVENSREEEESKPSPKPWGRRNAPLYNFRMATVWQNGKLTLKTWDDTSYAF